MTGDPSYTRSAVKALARAVNAEPDFAGWLAGDVRAGGGGRDAEAGGPAVEG
jgi:hypothetical protein